MTKKRFRITPELPEGWVDIIDIDNDRTLCNIRIEYANNIIKLLNELHEENQLLKLQSEIKLFSRRELEKENEQLKQALLFFLDVANSECSSSFEKDMEHDCRKLFNCSYSEAKDKYGDYDATWWELGE